MKQITFALTLLFLFGAFANNGVAQTTTHPLFNGNDLQGWSGVNKTEFGVEDGVMQLKSGMGWLRTDQIFDDFILEFECKPLVENYDSGLFFRSSLDGEPWPNKGFQVNLKFNGFGTLVRGYQGMIQSEHPPVKVGEWAKFRLVSKGEDASLQIDGKDVWEADFIEPEIGLIGIQAEDRAFAFRNFNIKETGYVNLLEGQGRDFKHLQVHQGSQEAWHIDDDGVLVCDGGGGGWIGTKTDDFGDFVFKFDFWVPKEGNSGIYIRRPKEGDGAYTAMEIQIIDDDAKHWGELQEWQKCGSIYHEVTPSVRATREAGQWQTMAIICNNNEIDIYINGVQITDADLDEYTTSTTSAKPLKERPRVGYLGFQNYDGMIKYRNAFVKRLN